MALKEHMNNCARLAQPGIWIFRGKAMVFLVIGFALFILIMQCLRGVQLEMPIAILISALPTLGLTVFVKFFVNDKPPSYAFDLLLFKIWRFKTWLFKAGVLSRPPGLWFLPEIIRHPKGFKLPSHRNKALSNDVVQVIARGVQPLPIIGENHEEDSTLPIAVDCPVCDGLPE